MNTVTKCFVGCAAAFVMSTGTASFGAMTDELTGNLFHQTGAPYDTNVSIAPNNPQNMGGSSAIAGSNYPIGVGDSAPLDGNVSTGWGSGTFGSGGMLNIGLTRGAYNVGSGFTTTAFDEITMVRIWFGEYVNNDQSYWQKFPTQVKIAYTDTTNFYPGNGYTYNSTTLGTTPADWDTNASITLVNGAAPSAPGNAAYATGDGWVSLAGVFDAGHTQSVTGNLTYGYVDLAVSIPAGTTSILFSFGEVNSGTGNQGGLDIREFQAIPEPASLGLLGMAGLALLARRRSTASV